VPAERLPDDQRARDPILQEYVVDRVPDAVRDGDMWAIRLRPPPRSDYYVDPRLRDGLAWWSKFARPTLIRDIPYAVRRRSGVQVSLSDAWTIASWSRRLSTYGTGRSQSVMILHVDDHEDLMSPRLVVRDSTLVDLISCEPVQIDRPATVDAALKSGAIGMGSFIAPMLAAGRQVHIRHLRMPTGRPQPPGHYRLVLAHEPDTLLSPREPRLAARVLGPNTRLGHGQITVGSYTLTETLSGWLDDLPADTLMLLHVDCDYFNNRYDGDSDWRSHSRIHDPSATQVQLSVKELCEALRSLAGRVDDVTIALSPGFFPAEYWRDTVEALLRTVAVRRRPRTHTAARRTAVRLVPAEGSPKRGGGPEGKFWHVYDGDRRAGSVWINRADDRDLGRHASMTIELNEASRGKGIGRRAYRLAAEASEQNEIWLHMRKSNISSQKAAMYAGFEVIEMPGRRQLVMRWRRPTINPDSIRERSNG